MAKYLTRGKREFGKVPYCLLVYLNVCLHRACVPLEVLVFTVILVCLLLHMQTTFSFLPGLAVDCFSNFTILTNELSKIGLSVNASKLRVYLVLIALM